MPRIFNVPFATQGDREEVPEPIQGDGSVSLTQGFGFDYERPYEEPESKDIRREIMNGLLYDITEAVGDIQDTGIAKWDSEAGPYPEGALVWHNGAPWQSQVGNNTDEPGEGGSWRSGEPMATEEEAGIIAIATQTEVDAGEDDTKAVTAEKLANVIQSLSGWGSKAIGEPFALRDDLPGVDAPPTDNASFRFIMLTAGQTGVGDYNNGALTNESVSGSAPLITATAEISFPDSPLAGQTINLINTEGRYIKPGAASGTVANDQMQRITGFASSVRMRDPQSDGALSHEVVGSPGENSGSSVPAVRLDLDTANSPDARTGDHTDVKHQQVTYYMRIA